VQPQSANHPSRHCGTGIGLDRDITGSWRDVDEPCASLPTAPPKGPAHAAATAGFSIQEGEIPRETDCLLEGDGFELPVPRERGWSFDRSLSSAPFKSICVSTKTTRFLREGPMVRIRLPPAVSPRTIGSSAAEPHLPFVRFTKSRSSINARCPGSRHRRPLHHRRGKDCCGPGKQPRSL
jgi:hypothetical protein